MRHMPVIQIESQIKSKFKFTYPVIKTNCSISDIFISKLRHNYQNIQMGRRRRGKKTQKFRFIFLCGPYKIS